MENNYYQDTFVPQPQKQLTPRQNRTYNNHTKKTIIVVSVITLVIVVISTIVTVLITQNHQADNSEEYAADLLNINRENTPLLQLYAALQDEEYTFESLKQELNNNNAKTKLVVLANGTGYIANDYDDDKKEFISFYYDPPIINDSENEMNDDESEDDEDNDYQNENAEITDYDLESTVSSIAYIIYHPRYLDSGFSIDYVEEDDSYYLNTPFDSFNYPTKKEAINAFLSSELTN